MMSDNGGPSQLEHFIQENARLREELRLQNEANDLLGQERDVCLNSFAAAREEIAEHDRWREQFDAALKSTQDDLAAAREQLTLEVKMHRADERALEQCRALLRTECESVEPLRQDLAAARKQRDMNGKLLTQCQEKIMPKLRADLKEARALLKLAGCKMQDMLNHGEWYGPQDVVDRIEVFLKETS